MAERNVREKMRALPHKIELRMNDLVQMGEFNQDDVSHCRRTYWGAREDWHKILVDCYNTALERQQRATTTAPAPAVAVRPPAPVREPA